MAKTSVPNSADPTAGDAALEVVLTTQQDARAVAALARFKAKCEAWRAGVPLEQLEANAWVIDVDAGQSEVA